jgi:hypothetical protein
VASVNNLLLDLLFNKRLQVYLDKHSHSLPKLVLYLVAYLSYLLSLNRVPYLEELLSLKIKQVQPYLDRILLVLFLANNNLICKVISLEGLQLKANQHQVYSHKVLLDKLEEVSLVILLRIIYSHRLNKLNHLLS